MKMDTIDSGNVGIVPPKPIHHRKEPEAVIEPKITDPRPSVEDRIDACTAEVKRVADAIESMVALCKAEIERTRR